MSYLKRDHAKKIADPIRPDHEWVNSDTTFPVVFNYNVAAHPHKPAIVTVTQRITYAELNEQANQIATTLLACAGAKAEPIALLFGQEIAAFSATIGVLKSGKFYVTLDPLYPAARLTEILADSGALILLTNRSGIALARQICPEQIQILDVDTVMGVEADTRTDHSTTPSNVALSTLSIAADAYAYIGYTSGSTGQAKGVIETHRNHICHWQNLMRAQPGYGKERVLFLNRLSFSGGQLAFYLTFLAGATLYLYDLQEDGIARLPDWIQQHQITVWNSVPTVFRAFVARVVSPQQIASIRLLRLASDTILAQDLEVYQRLFAPTCKLWFCYALTEAKTVTMAFLNRNDTISPTEIPSGWPIDGMELRIVDEEGGQLGANQVGEIIVRSRFVSPGYWRKAEMTATRFRPDPDEAGVYLLQTGDLGRVDEHGCLIHKGRKDTQVKIRGYRVELSEIEAHLAALVGVQEAAVRAQAMADGELRLAAYLVCTSNPPPSGSQLRQRLAERLPSYMIPNSFTLLEQMPVNRNGKIDRAALPIPTLSRPALDVPLATARTPLEATLAILWQELLGVDQIGIHDNFFDIGGHSLLAITLFERITKATAKSLPSSVVLQAPTIAQQAELIEQTTHQTQWSSLVAVRAGGSQPPLFLVPPAYGTALSFIKLAGYLDPDQPIYAFDPVGLNGIETPLDTIEAMAAHYINEIRTFQPAGPYRIGGKCMGGQVAFEMTHQLLAQGSKVEALLLLDSSAPANGPSWERNRSKHALTYYWQRLKVRLATRTLLFALKCKWQQFKRLSVIHHKPLEKLQTTNSMARMRYTATPIAQHLFFVQSAEYAHNVDIHRRWSALTSQGLTLKVVAGSTHRSILKENEEHIRQLACYVQEYLHQLDQESAESRQIKK